MKRNGSSYVSFSTSHNFNLRKKGLATPAPTLARITSAFAILACIAVTSLPLPAFADNQRCQLACCRGHASHVAGSCMSGACEAVLRRPIRKALSFQRGETLCGFSRITRRLSAVTSVRPGHDLARQTRSEEPTRLAPAAITNTCNSDCGGCLSTTFSTNRSRNVLATSHARMTAVANQFGHLVIDLVRQQGAVCRLSPPRGPPLFS